MGVLMHMGQDAVGSKLTSSSGTLRPALCDFKGSAHHPLLVTGNARAPNQIINGSLDPTAAVGINGPVVPFETDMFDGNMTMHFKGLPSTQASVFAGKRRTLHWVIQGRFKRTVAVDSLFWGQEFHFTQENPPLIKGLLARMVLKAAAAVSSGRAHIEHKDNYVCTLTPLAATCKVLNVSREGEQPLPMEAQEDARLLSPALADDQGLPLPSDKRHKLLETPAFTKGMMYDTEHVYTFMGWLHHMDWPSFSVDLAGFAAVDLSRWLPRGEPTLMMIKDIQATDAADAYMVNMAVWHERVVQLAEQAEQRKAASSNKAEKVQQQAQLSMPVPATHLMGRS